MHNRSSLKLCAIVAALLLSPCVSANNVEGFSRVDNGRVQLILTNTQPATPIMLERVELPVAVVKRRGTYQPTHVRTVAADGPVGERTVIDIGSVEEVFNGGGAATETMAQLRTVTTVGMKKCFTRNTAVTVLMKVSGGSIKYMRAVPTTFCLERSDPV